MAIVKRSDRLERVASLTRLKEEAAVRRLRDARASLARKESQQAQLESYRDEYESRTPDSGSSVSALMNYRVFCANLSGAIEHQSRLCEEENRRVRAALGEWQERHQRTQALEGAADRSRQEERKENDRLQSAIVDDMVNCRNIERS